MVPITAALTAEHKTFRDLFDRVERELPGLQTAAEVKALGRKVEEMLRRHSKVEDDLLLMAQNSAPKLKNRFARCLREHCEVSAEYVQLHRALRLTRAKTLLKEGLKYSRKHFDYEERFVFPLIEKVLTSETLTKLGSIWFLNHPSFQSVTSAKFVAN